MSDASTVSAGARLRTAWRWARPAGGVAILVLLVHRLGAATFAHAVAGVDRGAVVAAVGIAVVTTVCCAWRWSLVAAGLGMRVPLGTAVAAYYRSQFLNATLPGGVLGDVHRALRHGRDAGDLGRGVRAVAWERTAGQAVQVLVAVAVLAALPSPVRPAVPIVAGVALAVVAVATALPVAGAVTRRGRLVRAVAADARVALLDRRAWPGVLVASAVTVAGHVATFLVAARAAGVAVPPLRLLPVALVVLLAMGLPVNVGGFGPREGVAAWAFGAAGWGPAAGVGTAVAYGILVLVATLPGAAVLLVSALRRPRAAAGSPVAGPPVPRSPVAGSPVAEAEGAGG